MPLLERRPGGVLRQVFTVSELTGGLCEWLEEELGRVFVVGEISNLRRVRSGHVYFTLKDDDAQLRAALFRGTAARLPFDPEEGLEVVVEGSLTLYAPRGDLQIIVRGLEPRGQGALQLAFEQLRARLEAEGLFDATRKRDLPLLPRRLGIVTSPSGAALRDVVQVTGERCPATPLLLAPARVQGEGAEEEIGAALESLQRIPDVDVILLVRGGGSLEDLAPFNTERVARALRASRVPVVSGVGHEVDVTIADLAADARAPTPSAAAALVLPDRHALAAQLARDARRLRAAALGRVHRQALRLGALREALRARAPAARLAAQRARLDAARKALLRGVGGLWEDRRGRLGSLAVQLEALSPLGVLGRGYAIARTADGRVARSAEDVAVGDPVRVRLQRAELEARVEGIRVLPNAGAPAPAQDAGVGPGDPGSLENPGTSAAPSFDASRGRR